MDISEKETLNKIVTGIVGDEEVLLADGFERAFLGIGTQFGRQLAVYDRTACINILINQGMEPEEAEEYFQYNVEGSWVGESTPVFLTLLEDQQ
jgi:hypothetical protein